jgi:hypothetical protein
LEVAGKLLLLNELEAINNWPKHLFRVSENIPKLFE